jgi:hypothetical protein
MSYKRTSAIERAAAGSPGAIAGILATDGEASDGHILDIDGGDLTPGAPLLFGHDDFSGSRNLGSWSSFSVVKYGDGRAIRGAAQIELGGSGEQKAWREDVAHMIDQGHIGQFSIRWDPTDEPVKRTALPTEHAAYVDPKTAKGRKGYGLYFPRWKMLEGSVVTLGADPLAMIGRMQDAEGALRSFWRSAVNDSLIEQSGAEAVVALPLQDGELVYIERKAYESMLELANERLNYALDILEQVIEERRVITSVAEPNKEPAALEQEQAPTSAPLPDITPRMIYAALSERLTAARIEERETMRRAFSHARGETV